jgi:hypothetical protein
VIDLFEHIFLLAVGRVVKSDTGANMSSKKAGSSVPALEKATSIINEQVSETLIGQSFSIIFSEFSRYISIMKSFSGIDWTTYVNMRNKLLKEGNT